MAILTFALDVTQAVGVLEPSDTERAAAEVAKAREHRDLGDDERALNAAEAAVRIDPAYAAARATVAATLFNLGQQHDEAVAENHRAIALAPGEANYHGNAALLALEDRDCDGARDEALRMIALGGELGPAYELLGAIELCRGEIPAALDAFDRAVGAAPKEPRFRRNRGVARFLLDDRRGAEADWSAAAALGGPAYRAAQVCLLSIPTDLAGVDAHDAASACILPG